MDLASLVVGVMGLIALVAKLTDFLKLLTNAREHRSAVLTQLAAWGAGVLGTFLYAATDFGPTVVVADIPLDEMASATKLVLGLAIGSAASVLVDFKQAVDSTDSAKKPKLNL